MPVWLVSRRDRADVAGVADVAGAVEDKDAAEVDKDAVRVKVVAVAVVVAVVRVVAKVVAGVGVELERAFSSGARRVRTESRSPT